MSWCGIEGHDDVVERFRRAIQRGRLASSFLFVGPPGIGKRLVAKTLAQAFLCERHTESELSPCQECPSCMQVESDSHPDVDTVSRPEDKAVIPLELFIGSREHRSREGLCHRISLRPSSGRRRIAIIDDADWMNQEGANSLLKTLEEPPPRSLLILIGTSLQRQLPTIRSRCQIVRFQALEDPFIGHHLREHEWVEKTQEIEHILQLAEGSLDRAKEFADPSLRQFADDLAQQLKPTDVDSQAIAKLVQTFVEAVGREAPARRQRLRQVIQLRMHELRAEILQRVAAQSESGARHDPRLEVALERMERCLTALNQVGANANLPTLIECWIDDDNQASVKRERQLL